MMTGLQMLLRQLGFDPQEVVRKGAELEQVAKTFAGTVEQKVTSMDQRQARFEERQVRSEERQARIEALLIQMLNKQDAALARETPAGETGFLLEAAQTEQEAVNGGCNS